METKTKNHLLKWDWEEFEETITTISTPRNLSFCDLSELEKPEINHPNLLPLNQDFFEFSTTKTPQKPNPTPDNYIMFCGKVIPPKEEHIKAKLSNSKPSQSSATKTPQKLNPTSDNYIIFCENLIPPKEDDKKEKFSGSKPGSSRLQKARTLHQSSGKHKKQWVYIGMGRSSGPPGIMELRDMKQRQRKMAAARLEVGEAHGTGGSGRSLVKVDGNGKDGTGKGQWSLLRTLGFRAQLFSVLTKASLGCLTISAVS